MRSSASRGLVGSGPFDPITCRATTCSPLARSTSIPHHREERVDGPREPERVATSAPRPLREASSLACYVSEVLSYLLRSVFVLSWFAHGTRVLTTLLNSWAGLLTHTHSLTLCVGAPALSHAGVLEGPRLFRCLVEGTVVRVFPYIPAQAGDGPFTSFSSRSGARKGAASVGIEEVA